MRGVDEEGAAANFVETEQILAYNGEYASYVQTRGSIPLYWSQYPTIRYKPNPYVYRNLNHVEGFQNHLNSQLMYYGNQVLVNLIDKKGGEKSLGEAFENVHKASGYSDEQVSLLWFDFHKECSKMRYHRLEILMDQLKPSIRQQKYFKFKKDLTTATEQDGAIRTNCMDCLDRTNVVQSLVARYVLAWQLADFGLIPKDSLIADVDDKLEFDFKNLWADHADMISKQYSGTGALKTDFTRTGKRTRKGLLQDGVNSMIRYYKNNFADGFRQDSIDLLLGNYVVDPSNKSSPFVEKKDWKYMALPFILLLGFSMFIISLLLPSTEITLQLTYVIFWGLACMITLYFVVLFGTEFVNIPRLACKWRKEVQV